MIASQPMLTEEIAKMQLVKLKRLVHYLYNNSPYYQMKMDKASVRPEDLITLEDFAQFPIY